MRIRRSQEEAGRRPGGLREEKAVHVGSHQFFPAFLLALSRTPCQSAYKSAAMVLHGTYGPLRSPYYPFGPLMVPMVLFRFDSGDLAWKIDP